MAVQSRMSTPISISSGSISPVNRSPQSVIIVPSSSPTTVAAVPSHFTAAPSFSAASPSYFPATASSNFPAAVPIYNGDPDDINTEVIRLRKECATLQTENVRLQSQVNNLSYVSSLQSTHAYHLKCFRHWYTVLLEKMGKKLDDTKSEIEKMIHRVTPGYAPPGSISDIPLNPKREDWEHKMPFWRRRTWSKLRYGHKGPLNLESPILSAFMEDEHGRPVSEEERDAVNADVQGFWIERVDNPKTRAQLGPQGTIGFSISEEFRKQLEGKYPWLRLCEGHWKIAQLWKNAWTSWAKNHMKETATKGSLPISDDEKMATEGSLPTSDNEKTATEGSPLALMTRRQPLAVKNVLTLTTKTTQGPPRNTRGRKSNERTIQPPINSVLNPVQR